MTSAADDEKPKGPVVRWLSRLANLIWWLLLSLLVLAALYAGVGRQITQNISDYIPEFEQRLSEQFGQDVRIGSLSSSWSWLNPTLIARNLVVRADADSEEVVGSLESLRVGLDFPASLMRLRIVLSDFEADRLELVINQTPRGDVGVEGVDLPEPVANDLNKWIDLAGQWLSDPSVRITRVDLGLRDDSGNLRHVEIPQLDLVYRKGLFHAAGRAMRPGTTEQLASFELVGRHFFRGDFTGQLYADINSGRLFDGLIHEYSWRGIRAEGFDLGGQIWIDFLNGALEQAKGSVTTPYLQLGVNEESLAPLEDIYAKFGWRRKDSPSVSSSTDSQKPWYSTGSFHFQDITWRWNGETFPGFDLRLQSNDDHYELIANRFPLGPVRGIVSGLGLLPESAVNALANYQPTGRLDSLLLTLPRTAPEEFSLAAHLDKVSVKAFDGAPGVAGLDGTLTLTRDSGFVAADSAELTFGFPSLFKGLWEVTDFQAGVGWQFDGNVTRVYSDDIEMNYGAGSRLTGAFDLRMSGAGPDILGLQVGVTDATAEMLAEFVPVHVVDPGLYEWLNTAITKASISGTYYGHGRIDSRSPPGSFISSMLYSFKDADIEYDTSWPSVEQASGEVFVHQGQTRVDLASGTTGGIELQPGQVIVDPSEDATRIRVDVSGPVTGKALKRWMTESPLGEMAGEAGQSIELEGQFELDLGLGFALDSNQSPAIDASLTANSGSLTYPLADLEWTDLGGKVSYSSQRGFTQTPLEARFLGRPVAVWFSRSESGDALSIRQSGKADVETLLALTALPGDTELGLGGSLNYEARLEVTPDAASEIVMTSDLVGVAIDWPAPLGKLAAQPAPVEVRVRPGASDGVSVEVRWQDLADLTVDWASESIGAKIRSLTIGDRQIQALDMSALRGQDNWLITAESDWLRGMTTWPIGDDASESVVIVDLEHLSFERESETSEETPAIPDFEAQLSAFKEMDLASWPDVDVRVADLSINNSDAGRWSFSIRPEATRLQVQDIKGRLKSMNLSGSLDWGIPDGQERTVFQGMLNGESLGDIAGLVGTDVPFRNKKTAVELDLNWPGRPDQFALSRVSGSTKIRFDDGVILEGNNTAQLFRVFNILNSDTLWRRLKLDFSDLYEAGVAFDAISGKANMNNGVLTLDPELQIVGPSGAFKFSGKTDMARETLDMNMVVVLPLTQNLPLAALLMGAGAPIGGALFVLDKVLGDPLSKLTSATYSVSGPWDKPEVNLKRVFDTGK